MDSDSASINIGDHEIWERRRARLKALDSVTRSHGQAESKRRVNPLLHNAVKEGDVDRFIEVLEKYSHEERVSLSDIIDIRGPSGNSFLHVAASIENADILRALLEVIPDKQLAAEANHRGDTTLHFAARAGRIGNAELLLHCCDGIVHMVDDAGNTGLHEAVKNGNFDLTRLLLSRGSIAVYPENKERKSALYLAVETGNLEILKLLMEAMDETEVPWSRMQGMSPVHGAVVHRRLEMLKEMSKRKKELFDLRDSRGNPPLHVAISANYVDGVKFLVDEFVASVFEGDGDGYLPIHIACKLGHLEIIKKLLRHWPEPEELLTLKEGQNILHVAAKYGRNSVVNYIRYNPKLEKLMNAKDKDGNTPLHVATLQWQADTVFYLTRGNRVNLKLVNNNLTPLDIVDEKKDFDPPLQQRMTEKHLKQKRAPRSKDKALCEPKGLGPRRSPQPQHLDRLRSQAESRMLVATLIGTVTFAAGCQVPGGYRGSEPNAGAAMLLKKPMYDVFVVCNMIAMYNSMTAAVILLWAQSNDSDSVIRAIKRSSRPLLIALATMSVAFMAGVYVTVTKLRLIGVVTLLIGICALCQIWVQFTASWIRIDWPRLGHRVRLLMRWRKHYQLSDDEKQLFGLKN